MNRKKLYYRTESFLKEAYRADNIRYRSGVHCPVAHLIARNMGYKVWCGSWYNGKTEIMENYHWGIFIRYQSTLKDKLQLIKRIGLWQYLIQKVYVSATGYKAAELIRIENAFEGSYNAKDDTSRDILKGLMAVFAVLKEIHNITPADFPVNSKIAHTEHSDAIIDRLVNRHESLICQQQS